MKVARPVRRAGQGNPPRRKAARAPWSDPYTYVPCWTGVVYVAFVIDVFSRLIVGWKAATSMHTELVLDAIEMAIWTRDHTGHPIGTDGALIHHLRRRQPVHLDRGIAHLKNWKILHTDYRRPLHTFNEAITIALGLYFLSRSE